MIQGSLMQNYNLLFKALSLLLLQVFSPIYAEKPNVLLILTDDQGYGDLSIHGNQHIKTPHLDALGRQSIRFDRFFVNSVCAPSRASILTGRYALRTGVFSVTRNGETIKPSEVTLGEAFKSAHYTTSFIGKWHSGSQYPSTPPGQGFDEFFGFTGGHINNYFDTTLLRGSKKEKTEGYITDVLTDEAIRFISDHRDQPFFCHLSYNAPHSPYQVPDEYFNRFDESKYKATVASHLGMCENIDHNVGRLLDTLDQKGLRENTIVLFLTDNGGTAGRRLYNAGMKGGKTSTDEGGSRVPLFVSWPKANWKPRVIEKLSAHIDLFPTLMDLCDIKAPKGPKLDGISLVPLLNGQEESWPDRTLFLHNGIDEKNRYPGAVRTERYRLNCSIPGPQSGSAAKNLDDKVRPWQLYDMHKDPGQKNNLAAKMPEKVSELSRLYETWVDNVSSEGRNRRALPVGYAEHNPVAIHASQSYFDQPIRYESGRGFANDWLTDWNTIEPKIWFDVDVVQDGTYEISLEYGSTFDKIELEASCQDSKCSNSVPKALAPEVKLPHRSKSVCRNRKWGVQPLGTLNLKKGKHKIELQATDFEGEGKVDFKSLILKRQT